MFQPNWESLDKRPTPQWVDDVKFGIFIHWGVYSVPAWAPTGGGEASYAEWYWKRLADKDGPTWKFHVENYGEKFQYQDFAPMFKAEMFDPDQWANLFDKAGIKYVVFVSRHHDGFCLWPSAHSWNWNSVDIGPHRDICGDLSDAVKARGIKMGFYYSLYEWYNPDYLNNLPRYVDEHMIPQMKDLVTRYEPSLVWTDGEWEKPSEDWKSVEFLSWLFNESPVKDEVAVNDRWGKETRSVHGGYYTTEYGQIHLGADLELGEKRKWEECRGIGQSFGFNRNETLKDYMTGKELVHLLVQTVAKGGNLLLDIGPAADGTIPVIMEERLLEIGDWLKVNGEAIYGTRPWRAETDGGKVAYTAGSAGVPTGTSGKAGESAAADNAPGATVYAISLKWPGSELVLNEPKPSADTTVTMLGVQTPLKWRNKGGKMHVEIPALSVDDLPCSHAYVFKLTKVE